MQRGRTISISVWLPRLALLAIWLAAFVLTGGLEAAFPASNELALRASLQTFALALLVVSLVQTALAARRPQLWISLVLILAAATLQAASAWDEPVVPGRPPGLPSPLLLLPASRQLLYGAGATLVCFLLILALAYARLPRDERPIPLHARLRGALRSVTLSPVSLFFGPVFQKEVRVAGRRRITYWFRALYPLTLIGVASVAYVGLTLELSSISGAQRLQRLQHLAPSLAIVIAWCQFACLIFIAPLMTAPAVCDERRALTMPALMTTPLTSAQIILGKLTSRLVQLVILSLVAAPLLLALRVFGGLDAEVIVATTSVTLSAAVLAASLGLMYSVWHRRAATAAVFAFLTMAVFVLAVIVAMILTSLRTNLPPSGWLLGLSAPTAMGAISAAVLSPWPGMPEGFVRHTWITCTAVNLALAAAVCLFAAAALRRAMRAELAGAIIDREARPAASAARARSVGDRPVIWREVRQATLGSRRRLIIVSVAVALAMGWLYSRVPLSEGFSHITVCVIGMLVLLLQASLATTSAVAAEREQKTWDVLMTTPLSGGEILGGKFLGGLRRQWFAPAWMAAHFLLAVATRNLHPAAPLQVAAICVASVVFLCGTGLLMSVLFRRSTAAAVANLGLALALWIGLPVGVAFTLDILDIEFDNHAKTIFTGVISINPMVMSVLAIDPAVEGGALTPFAHLSYDLPRGMTPARTFTAILTATTTAGTLSGLACLLLAIRLFRRVSGRSS